MHINPFTAAMDQLHLAEEAFARSKRLRSSLLNTLQQLKQPERYIEVAIPVSMDNGSVKIFKGYRVQYTSLLGPYKGGIRFHESVSLDEVKALSFWMGIKCAVAGLPLGGGKGGVIVNPKTLSTNELERLARGYAKAIADVIGIDRDIPAPDVNTNSVIMGWMLDSYMHLARVRRGAKVTDAMLRGVFTGKRLEDGGSEGREEATGLGGWYALRTILARLKKRPKTLTAAVQGFGNVGFHVTRFLVEAGVKVIAVSDSHGGILVPEGVNPDFTLACKKKNGFLAGCYCSGSVCDLAKGKPINNAALLELPVDILVPSALENVLTKENANRIQASIILEMANGPTTPDADALFHDRGIEVIPDVLANGGGVTVSCFEWQQNIGGEHWAKDVVLHKLDASITKATETVWDTAKRYSVPMRTAAFMVALERMSGGEQ